MDNFEENIIKNICRLEKNYRAEFAKRISSFISLGIENQYDIILRSEQSSQDIDIEILIQKMLNSDINKISLLGGPGAGKSTLLLKMALSLTSKKYNNMAFIPVLIKCGLEKNDDLKKLIHLSKFSEEEKERLWEDGRLFLIFDGINEASNIGVKEFLNKIALLSIDYPECKYIVSCRTLEFPSMEYSPFERFTVLPVTDEQIKNNLKMELGDDIGEKYFSELCHSSKNYLLDICRIPLLLSLVINILSSADCPPSLEELRSKSDIYEQFYESLKRRQQMKNTIVSNDMYFELRDEIFKTLSYYMQGKGLVYIEESELVSFIRNMKYTQGQSIDTIKYLQKKNENYLWYWQVVDDLKKCGILNVYNKFETKTNTLAFIHQSFQEYFAGCFLSSKERLGNSKYSIFLLQNQIKDGNVLKLSNTKKNWATIEFASNLDANNIIISYIMRYSQKREDSNALELAANCIIQDATENKCLVDDCCIWLLEAFKYWSIPYKYNLIYAANSLLNHVSPSFPERLKKDIIYFGKKYIGGYTTIEYPESFDFNFLKQIIEKEKLEHKLNAIFSLGERNWSLENASIILDFLFSLFSYDNSNIREQAVKSIKGVIEHNPSVRLSDEKMRFLIKIIENKKETGAIRTYTLNTVAKTGDTRAIPIFMNYLKDKENPYRDSASWSLQELVVKSSDVKYSKDFMRKFYYDCLISESNDEDGMYSKGNLVYTLSKLNATSYIDKLKKWIVNENEPYVQEDGINAIGVLADITDLPFIEKYTLSSDPVIRSKAYKSLLQIDKENFLEKKHQQISGDPYSIVNYIVDESTFDTTETLDELLSISPDNNKIYDQTYESVGTVINC